MTCVKQVVFVWFLLCAGTGFAQSCDCTSVPIRPVACLPICRNALLLKSDKTELTQEFKLDPTTAGILIDKRTSTAEMTVDKLKLVLPPDTYEAVAARASSLSSKDTVDLARKYSLNNVDATELGVTSATKKSRSAAKKTKK